MPLEFSARFSCLKRRYRYFFVGDGMNLPKMREAANLLLGTHDFRNFCKIDAANVDNYERTISAIHIRHSYLFSSGSSFRSQMCEAIVEGTAFLWHQIRCIMAILFLIGKGLEDPSVISSLLDVNTCPGKPQYNMASEVPLVLYDCEYEGLEFKVSQFAQQKVWEEFDRRFLDSWIRTALCYGFVEEATKSAVESNASQTAWSGIQGAASRSSNRRYQKLLERTCAVTLEEKKKRVERKRKRLSQDEEST